jgi:hypothetical protein
MTRDVSKASNVSEVPDVFEEPEEKYSIRSAYRKKNEYGPGRGEQRVEIR